MITKFQYINKVMVDVLVPSQDYVFYHNNKKGFITVEGKDDQGDSFSKTITVTKKGAFLWKNLPYNLRHNADFKKFCKKVWRLRGLV